jgi:uncharacterized protein YdaU (DUF1376 family)
MAAAVPAEGAAVAVAAALTMERKRDIEVVVKRRTGKEMTDIYSLKRRLGKEMIHIDGCKEKTRKGNVI